MRLLLSILIPFFLTTPNAIAQLTPDESEALRLATIDADDGHADRAVAAIKKIAVRHPDNYAVAYELGYAHMAAGSYKKAADTFHRIQSLKEADDKAWQMEGNALDYLGRRGDAVRVYRDGLKKFPKSGALIMELGTIRMREKDYAGALEMYERGVAADPDYAPNYYRAAWINFHSNAPWDGIAQAERFMVMELKGERVEEMSKMTFDAYAALISTAVQDDKDGTISQAATELGFDPKGGEEAVTLRIACGVKKALHAMRAEDGSVAASVWDFEERVAGAGHWEAYCRWLLRKGREEEFGAWLSLHEDLMERFAEWMGENGVYD